MKQNTGESIQQSEFSYVKKDILEENIRFFNQNGYLIIKNAILDTQLQKYNYSILKLFKMQAEKCGYTSSVDIDNYQGEKVDLLDQYFEYFQKNDRHAFNQAIEILPSLFESKLLFYSKRLNAVYTKLLKIELEILSIYGPHILAKLPNINEGIYTWHTEAHWFPKRRKFLNIWFPFIRDQNENNGTMYILPTSHKINDWQFSEYRQKNEGKFDFVQYDIPNSELDGYNEMPVNISIGDVFISDRNMVHRGSLNKSSKPSYVTVGRVFDYSCDLTLSSNPSERPYKTESEKNGRMGMVI